MSMATRKRGMLMAAVCAMSLAGCGPAESNGSSSSSSSEIPSSSTSEFDGIDRRGLNPIEYAYLNLTGTDAVGRKVERGDGFRYKNDEKKVGLYYSVWLGQHDTQQLGVYNVSYLEETEEGRAALLDNNITNKLSPTGQFHFWGEPLYDYYDIGDPFVLTRHVELFVNAGIDYLSLDTTNAVTYPRPTFNLLDTLLKFRAQGYKVPKVFFYTNSRCAPTVEQVYSIFYSRTKYEPIWFSLDGIKPLLVGVTPNNNGASDMSKYPQGPGMLDPITNQAMYDFFDIRESEWPNGDHHEDSIPWMSWDFPQRIHEKTKAVAIPVAQHSHSRISASYMDPESSRGYNNETGEVEEEWWKGRSFQDMWDSALERQDEIDLYTCTTWNEWMAIKQPVDASNPNPFWVDVYNNEYSRDMEMSKNPLIQDNFYLQLLENIRKLKVSEFVEYKKETTTIDITSSDKTQWDGVKAHYQDYVGDAINRDYDGAVQGLHYTSNTARNDISLMKVTEDDDYLYFFVETKDAITEYVEGDTGWMNIFLNTKEGDPNWNGFNYVINRTVSGQKSSIEKSTGGFEFEKVGEADISVNGNLLQVRIPKNLIGYEGQGISFKVADNVTNQDDIMDYYVTGDVAPLGRLGYGY